MAHTDKTPLPIPDPMTVEGAWIDLNGHLNMAYYNVLFDRGLDAAFAAMGIGWDYTRARRHTIYTAEFHVRYLRELHEGDQVTAGFRLLAYDTKRLHTWQELRHVDGWLAATGEGLALHVDMAGPKVVAFPADITANLESAAAAQADVPWPARAGRAVGLGSRP